MSQTLEQKIALKLEGVAPNLKKSTEDGGRAEAGRMFTYREDGYEFEITVNIRAHRLTRVS